MTENSDNVKMIRKALENMIKTKFEPAKEANLSLVIDGAGIDSWIQMLRWYIETIEKMEIALIESERMNNEYARLANKIVDSYQSFADQMGEVLNKERA